MKQKLRKKYLELVIKKLSGKAYLERGIKSCKLIEGWA